MIPAPRRGVRPCAHEPLWMPNARECIVCWLRRQGWNEATGEFEDLLPFEQGVDEAEEGYTTADVMASSISI